LRSNPDIEDLYVVFWFLNIWSEVCCKGQTGEAEPPYVRKYGDFWHVNSLRPVMRDQRDSL